MKMDAEETILKKLELDLQTPDPGCCGMAGGFGFESGSHYDVATKIGEQRLFPAVAEAPKDTLVIANGFSCREMISQTTDRQGLHLAQVIRMGMDEGPSTSGVQNPERRCVKPIVDVKVRGRQAVMIGLGALICMRAIAWAREKL